MASCLLGAAAVAIAACDSRPLDVKESFSMTPPAAHGTGAKTRLVTTTVPENGSTQGRIVPRQIVCVEPSPDTASSISSAISAAFAGSGEGKGVSAAVAGQFGKAVAESLVQLTERTATIQLLRDGLHRACEAYSNGAISDITYALIVSRIDEVMVTLTTSELAAGAVGRRLASTSGQAGFVQGGEPQNVDQAERAVTALTDKIKTSDQSIAAKRAELASKSAKTNPNETETGEIEKLKTQVAAEESERDSLNLQRTRAEMTAALARLGKSGGFAQQAGTGAGGLDLKASPQIATQLKEIYERFMDGNPAKSMTVACVTALDRPMTQNPLQTACKSFMENEAKQAAEARILRAKAEALPELVKLQMEHEFRLRMARIQAEAVASIGQACAPLTGAERTNCMQAVKPLLEASLPDAAGPGAPRPTISMLPLPAAPAAPKKP